MSGGSAASRSEDVPRFLTLCHALDHWSRLQPQSIAVSSESHELSYGELSIMVQELSSRLSRVGVGPGDRVALIGLNTVEWVGAFLATLAVSALVVPMNNRLSLSEVLRQIEICRPAVVLCDAALLGLLERAGLNPQDPLRRPPVFCLEQDAKPSPSIWRQPVSAHSSPHLPTPEAPALISLTSGTTGQAKGAVISHDALVSSAMAYVPHLATAASDATLVMVPLFHNTGFVDQLAQMLLVGGRLDLLREFHLSSSIEALERRPASYLIAVPSIFRLLMLHERADSAFRTCKVAVYGGAPMPATWADELRRRWPHLRLFNAYGLTEFTSVSHLLHPDDAPSRGGSVGRPVEGVRHRIVGEGERTLDADQAGEVWLAGRMMMLRYWEARAATEEAFRGDWLRTGDMGSIDQDGFLTVIGRSAEIINRGGEKVFPTSIEERLNRMEGVSTSAVVGAPHPILQERVVACVVMRKGYEFDEQAARSDLLDHVPDYAVPDAFLVVDELPHNASGKLDRASVREVVAGVLELRRARGDENCAADAADCEC